MIASALTPKSLTVMHLEDQEIDRHLVRGKLGSRIKMVGAGSLREALGLLAIHTQFDVFLIDLDLADSRLTDTVAALRPYRTPIVALSGHDSPSVIRKVLALGVDRYVSKGEMISGKVDLFAVLQSVVDSYHGSTSLCDMDAMRLEGLKPYITCGAALVA